MPEFLARRRLLCGHRPGAAGSSENLIGGDRASPGDNNSPCSQRPGFQDPQLVSWRTTGLGSKLCSAESKFSTSPRPQAPSGLP